MLPVRFTSISCDENIKDGTPEEGGFGQEKTDSIQVHAPFTLH
jgi:hypothetical protein